MVAATIRNTLLAFSLLDFPWFGIKIPLVRICAYLKFAAHDPTFSMPRGTDFAAQWGFRAAFAADARSLRRVIRRGARVSTDRGIGDRGPRAETCECECTCCNAPSCTAEASLP